MQHIKVTIVIQRFSIDGNHGIGLGFEMRVVFFVDDRKQQGKFL